MTDNNNVIHIFIVENNKIYLSLLEYIFKKRFNNRFYNFLTEEECLSHFHLNPDIVVIDDSLPGSYDTIMEIRKNNANTRIICLVDPAGPKVAFESAGV